MDGRCVSVLFLCLIYLSECSARGGHGGGHGGSHSGSHGGSHGGRGHWGSHSYGGSHSYSHGNSHGSNYGHGSSHSEGGGSALSRIFSYNRPQTHTYPHSSGLSGSGSRSQYPRQYVSHTYYTAPQHIYVTQYRDSESKYRDLLTGLALYDRGRSHSGYYHSYYHDGYYRRHHSSSSSSTEQPLTEAVCTLRITENEKTDILKIPCEIVTTFTSGSLKVSTVRNCTSNVTVIKFPPKDDYNSENKDSTSDIKLPKYGPKSDSNNIKGFPDPFSDTYLNKSEIPNPMRNNDDSYGSKSIQDMLNEVNSMIEKMNTDLGEDFGGSMFPIEKPTTEKPVNLTSSSRNGTATTTNITIITANEKTINITVCNEVNEAGSDPLNEKGLPVDPLKTKCAVDIKTNEGHMRNDVDCRVLIEYSKMTPPLKEPVLLPSRGKLEDWLSNPPWWASVFIAV